jgi:tetratricopeptide (TPR) repeat protein
MSNEAGKKPTVFISYSHKDEKDWKDRLVTHLGVLRAQGLIDIWEDREIEAGADWHKNIQDAMGVASIAVILISADSLTSDYILNDEVPPLIERATKEGVRIFPLVVEPCAWQAVKWLRAMNLRPKDGRPLSAGNENQIDEDLAALTSEIYLLTQAAAGSSAERTFVPLDPDAVSTSRLPVTGRELFGRELELDMLDGAWADSNTNVLSLIAWGGVGKSALVNHWLRKMARDNYRGAEKVYAWSFYRQGTSEQGVSADQFIDAALRWFGDTNPTEGSPWDKGERLARLIKRQRTLLLLDGLEPLQYAPGRGQREGALKEQSMQALLRELAARNPGLCVITSRLPVADLNDFEGDTARRINLEHLSPQAGAEVLKAQRVVGEQSELEKASAEFGGHALAITLLGSYLKNVYKGDISQRHGVDILKEDEELGGHAQRVMASYERWFGEVPELAVLRMLGLFDRPADGQAITALRAAPGIPGLTDTLQNSSEEDWRRTLVRLRSARLIADEDPKQPNTLDAHPLVREHFKRQLKRHRPDAWREGNDRLYEHLKKRTKEFPDTVEEMAPLYTAVAHGCAAGRHQEALLEVYYRRICRGEEFFSIAKLGAFGADLAALGSFFDPPWQKPVPELSDEYQAFILGHAGSCLRALGRLTEAVQLSQAGLEARISLRDWRNASAVAINLSELYLIIGDLRQALAYAEQSRELADRSGDSFRRMVGETKLADALSQAGRLSEAEEAFREAERMQQDYQTQSPLLYSLPGFLYCDLLLGQGKYEEVESRASQTLQVAKRNLWLLDIALDLLSLGRAYLLRTREEETDDYAQATDYLNQAVNSLRQAGTLHHLPRGLLARAELRILKGDFSRARADLDGAMSIAARGEMGLHQVDCHLGYARLHVAQGEKEKARESWAKAKGMIERMGYGRREKDVKEIGRELGEVVDE